MIGFQAIISLMLACHARIEERRERLAAQTMVSGHLFGACHTQRAKLFFNS